ncbi:MAG: hypothetical protein ACLQK4_02630 [Acidimicrobiales bacterium]|jgi:hypothetical protein
MVSSSCPSRRIAIALSLALAAPVAGVALTSGRSAAGAAVKVSHHRHHKHNRHHPTAPACPTKGGIPFSGTLSDGALQLGNAVSGSGLSGTVCGLLVSSSSGFKVSIPQAEMSFAPTHVTILGFASLPATVTAAGNGTGTVSTNSDGTFNSTISVPVTSTVSAFGFMCTVGPFTPVLTTGTSGSVSGTPLSGSLTALTGRLAAGEFSVPSVQPSKRCPFLVAALVNLLTGLPLEAGSSSLTATATLGVT